MMSSVLVHLFRFLLFLPLQVFVIGKLNINTYIHPNILVLFLLILPANLKPAPTLFIGFFTGLILDMFTDSPGFNSTSFLVAAYVRLNYIKAFMHLDVRESSIQPGIGSMGFRWFIVYAATISLVHHLVYVFVENFRLYNFFSNLWSALLSTLVTLLLVFLFQILFFRTRSSE